MKFNLNSFPLFLIIICILNLANGEDDMNTYMPANYRLLKNTTSYDQMLQFLNQIAAKDHIRVEKMGASVDGRNLFVVKLDHQKSEDPWRVFFYAQQHGNEPAGKEALLYLIRKISEEPDYLPDDVVLWIIPTVNPDGAESNRRSNKNEADLNRDHQILAQPETQVLYRTFRSFMPHVSVDCHEFTRDSKDYQQKGWLEWPIIMMGAANNPLFHPDIIKSGLTWIERVVAPMERLGHHYTRYYVGGVPPDEEQRFSSPEMDDARNGLGGYGGLSFIIESGVQRAADREDGDLGNRVAAYFDLLSLFLHDQEFRVIGKEIVDKSRAGRVPEFIPTNYFWGSLGPKINSVKVIDRSSGKTESVRTANFMTDMIVKNNVKTPLAYAIDSVNAKIYTQLLKNHDIPYEILESPQERLSQGVELIEYNDQYDAIYNRYSGRITTKTHDPAKRQFPRGSVFVRLNLPDGIRSILLLEPNMMYGIYSSEMYRNLIDDNRILPVWRILE